MRVLLPLLVSADPEGQNIAGASGPLQGRSGFLRHIDGLRPYGSLHALGRAPVRELAVVQRMLPLMRPLPPASVTTSFVLVIPRRACLPAFAERLVTYLVYLNVRGDIRGGRPQTVRISLV